MIFQDWDKPENIPDPDAKKPDDWDEEMDGEWEPPMVTNPDYKVAMAQDLQPVISYRLLTVIFPVVLRRILVTNSELIKMSHTLNVNVLTQHTLSMVVDSLG